MDSSFSDIFLLINTGILAMAGYLIYRKRKELADAAGESGDGILPLTKERRRQRPEAVAAIACVALTALSAVVASVTYDVFFHRVAAMLAVTGAWLAYCARFGWRPAKLLIFPVGYLMLGFVNFMLCDYALEMREMFGAVSSFIFKCFGVPVSYAASDMAQVFHRHALDADGSVTNSVVLGQWALPDRYLSISTGAGHGFLLGIANECGGIRSLAVTMAIAAPYARLTQRTPGKRWTLFLLSIPLALSSNLLRIIVLGVFAMLFTQELAMKWFHPLSGLLVYVLAITLLRYAGILLAAAPGQTRQQKRQARRDAK